MYAHLTLLWLKTTPFSSRARNHWEGKPVFLWRSQLIYFLHILAWRYWQESNIKEQASREIYCGVCLWFSRTFVISAVSFGDSVYCWYILCCICSLCTTSSIFLVTDDIGIERGEPGGYGPPPQTFKVLTIDLMVFTGKKLLQNTHFPSPSKVLDVPTRMTDGLVDIHRKSRWTENRIETANALFKLLSPVQAINVWEVETDVFFITSQCSS